MGRRSLHRCGPGTSCLGVWTRESASEHPITCIGREAPHVVIDTWHDFEAILISLGRVGAFSYGALGTLLMKHEAYPTWHLFARLAVRHSKIVDDEL